MRKYIRTTWDVLKETITEFIEDNAIKFSASLAYYTIFSLPPMLMVIISLSGFFFGKEAVQGKVYYEISNVVGPKIAFQIQEMIKNVRLEDEWGFSSIMGIIVLFIGATGVFTEIQDSINIIWGVKAKPKRGWLKLILNRLLSFSMIISLGFLLVVSLVINTLILLVSEQISVAFPEITLNIVHIFNFTITFAVITLLFAIIYKFLPDAHVRWKDVGVGAVATSLLFVLGKFIITFYISHTNFASANGAAGSIIILLIWIYYSSAILYLGAIFTQVYAQRFGRKIIPSEYAVLVETIEIEKQTPIQ